MVRDRADSGFQKSPRALEQYRPGLHRASTYAVRAQYQARAHGLWPRPVPARPIVLHCVLYISWPYFVIGWRLLNIQSVENFLPTLSLFANNWKDMLLLFLQHRRNYII